MVVVITGASAGVGRATAREFARRGADVALIARGIDGLVAARREIEALGRRAVVLPADVADPEAVERAARDAERELGPIDVWVNNAMTSVFSPVSETDPVEYRRVMEVNYLGYVHGTLAALRYMRPRGRGVIVQVSSALAYRSIPLQSAYCASKHAIKGFTESLITELKHDRSAIRVTMVHLPGLNTPQFSWVKSRLPRRAQPVPPIYQPEIAARAIVWAAGHRRRSLSVGAPTVKAIFGNRVAPALLDRWLAWRGYQAQQHDGHAPTDRPHNLWCPLPGDAGAHGTFDARAKSRSLQVALNLHRGLVLSAVLGAAALYVARRLLGRRASSRPSGLSTLFAG
jgi:NAD(P)-dependent dehydrogenase (short-subunit alcohol dehydrogenase family)